MISSSRSDLPPAPAAQHRLAGYDHHAAALSRTATVRGKAEWLAACCSVLHHYAPQLELRVAVVLDDSSQIRRRGQLQVSSDPSAQLSTFVAAGERVIADLLDAQAPTPHPSASAEVAVIFLPERSDELLARALDQSTYHDQLSLVVTPSDLHIASAGTPLFAAALLPQLADSLISAFDTVSHAPDTTLQDVSLVSAAQRAVIANSCQNGEADYERIAVVRLFERHAAAQPHALAVRCKDRQFSYGELDARSNQLAHYLRSLGVEPNVTVAVCLTPSVDLPLALLAIFKAGGIYVPIDPTHPPTLIAMMLEEAAPRVVLTHVSQLALTECGAARLCLDRDEASLAALPTTSPDVALELEQPSHLVYTSGTTGRPKGVLSLQRNLAHYLQVARLRYGFSPSDAFCSLARYTFSISMFELLSPLIAGASLDLLEREEILSPERLARRLQDMTVLHAGPSLLGSLFRYLRSSSSAPRVFPRMRHASSGGDVVPPHLLEDMKQIFCDAEIYVIYGCTEISCMGCTFPVTREHTLTQSFVGAPFPGVQIRVVDEAGRMLPYGVKGEIWFAGKGVVPGYFKRPELNAEKFVESDGLRFYKTGDVGRLHADGNLEMLGRRDYQVQLRGMRVELLGIENTVCTLGLAAQCAVAVKQIDQQDTRLIAFVVGPRTQDVASFRRELAAHLPDYMIPQNMIAIDAMPVTHNGKLDRRKLAELPWDMRSEAPPRDAEPRNAVEIELVRMFREVLGVKTLGIDDDFFDLGGHSLSAVLLMEKIENALGMQLAPGLLFQHGTVRALAEHARDGSEPKAILLSPDADKPALFMVAGVHLYRDFARHLEDRYSVYGVFAARELLHFETIATPSVIDLAKDYLAIIRAQQPHGPYRLAGMSFGGIVAYEVAQQLRAAGERVVFLGLLDSVLPEPGWRGRFLRARRIARLPRRELRHWLMQRVRARFAGERHTETTFIRHTEDPKLRALEDARQDAYVRAATSYMRDIRPCDGPVDLVVAEERIRSEQLSSPDCGWQKYAPQLRIRRLPAEHLDLVVEPAVTEVASFFRAGLQG